MDFFERLIRPKLSSIEPFVIAAVILAWLLTGLTGCASGLKTEQEFLSATSVPQAEGQLVSLCEKGLKSACALIGRAAEAEFPLPVLQSATNETEARFAVVVDKTSPYQYFVRSASGWRKVSPERIERADSAWAVDQLTAEKLDVKLSYELIIVGPKARLMDRRNFRALDRTQSHPTVAVASCMDAQQKQEQKKIWPELLSHRPQALLLIGDNIYPPGQAIRSSTPAELWQSYAESRLKLELFRANPLIPIFATWDDHDYGQNDGDRTFEHKLASKDIFLAYFPQKKEQMGLDLGPGVASWWSAFGVNWALLDDRTFRTPNRLATPDQTHFGVEQEKWLSEHLAKVSAPVFFVSGDQFFGGYHSFESFQGSHPEHFKKQLDKWRKVGAPIVFVSGDRHLTEIIQVPKAAMGYPTFEITSSGIHARMHADAFLKQPSPNQLVGMAGVVNYALIQIDEANGRALKLTVRSYGPNKQLLFDKKLIVKK